MVRDWALVGGDPAPGEPAAYDDLAAAFRRTSSNAGHAHKRLSDLKDMVDENIWKGDAADAFREQIGKLPKDLERLHNSYEAAADAMAAYGSTLRTLQTEAGGFVEAAELAREDEDVQRRALDNALTVEPTTPTTPYDDAMEKARQRIRGAKASIDDIRERRHGAETMAISGLDDAYDLGIKNKNWLQRRLADLAEAAEFVAFALAVIAIVVVVVVLLTNPAGWAALSAALAMAAPLFQAATLASLAALVFKTGSWFSRDQDVMFMDLVKDGAWLAASFGVGHALGKITAPGLQVVTREFTQHVTEIRPVLNVVTKSGGMVVYEARTTITVVRAVVVEPVRIPLHIGTMWNIASSSDYDIPKYLGDNPVVGREMEGRPVPKPALGTVLNRNVACSAVHTPIPATVGGP